MKTRLTLACITALLFSLVLDAAADSTKTAVPMSKVVILSCPTRSVEDFTKLVAVAKEIGATDVDVSDLPKDRWQWFDPTDPYPNWSMRGAGILKVIVPSQLRPEIPTDIAEQSQKILADRGRILRQNGLHAFFNACEPMWLPESIYVKHPHWRGPTCQAPERSRHNYYAPNVDDPEVQELYRNATAALCKLAPIDNFAFLTGDSGSGLAWDPALYTGANGPADCKNRPLADRVNSFMAIIHDGAKEAGLDASVTISTSKVRLVVPGRPNGIVQAGDSDYGWASKVYPVVGIPDPVHFAEQLEMVFAHPEMEWRIGVPAIDCSTSFDLVRLFGQSSIRGPLQRVQALNTVAAKMVGETNAATLVQAWQEIHDAIMILQQIDNGGPVLLLGGVNQRWLIRPLVPYPLELTPDEKDYFRRFQFQANTEENAANLMNLQGLYAISGDAGTNLANDIFQHTIGHLQDAQKQLQALLDTDPKLDDVRALNLRVQALILVTRNADITARYQAYLDHFTPGWALRSDRHGHPDIAEGKSLIAEDQANTTDLINLIKSTSIPLIDVATTNSGEDVFTYGPELLGQLAKKIAIEQSHLPDLYRL